MKSEIIKTYRKTNSVKQTWYKFSFKGISYRRITEILREAGELNQRGGCRYKEPVFVPDESRMFRYLTDNELSFEDEIKTAIYN